MGHWHMQERPTGDTRWLHRLRRQYKATSIPKLRTRTRAHEALYTREMSRPKILVRIQSRLTRKMFLNKANRYYVHPQHSS